MPWMYLPMVFYSAMMEFAFHDWGRSKQRVTIIAEEPEEAEAQGS